MITKFTHDHMREQSDISLALGDGMIGHGRGDYAGL
jgi:hypothetical protein